MLRIGGAADLENPTKLAADVRRTASEALRNYGRNDG
jgi:hypothetical protein